jgi:hypothetical protein
MAERENTPDWTAIRAGAGIDAEGPGDWPPHVKPIGMDGLSLLGVDSERVLYWDGKQIKVERTLHLKWWQTVVAICAAVGAFLAGAGAIASGAVDLLTYLKIGWTILRKMSVAS